MFDVAIIGGGIVGLATAYRLGQRDPDMSVVVVEKENDVALHQTGRNSGVIHSGVYYTPGSLKATNCLRGKRELVEFCDREGIAYDMCGKVIVAVGPGEVPGLEEIHRRGTANGVACELIGRERLQELEPHAAGVRALHVPDAGIVDYPGVAHRFAEIIRGNGNEVRTGSRVTAMRVADRSVVLETTSGAVEAKYAINCAGLYSDKIAKMNDADPGVRIVPFRGEYYQLRPAARHLCRNLIYPVPDPAYPFLGIHFTRMIDGRVEVGPSAIIAFAREGYRRRDVGIRESLETLFYPGFHRLGAAHWRKGMLEIRQSISKKYYLKALRRLVPEVDLSDLEPAPSGVRAQALRRDGSMVDDFLVTTNRRVVNVCNAPSPAATASLTIGDYVADQLESLIAA